MRSGDRHEQIVDDQAPQPKDPTGLWTAPRRGILFMQSQEFLGADTQLHLSLMRHLGRDRFDVHCAAPKPRRGAVAAPTSAVRKLGDVHVRETEFGPSLEARSRLALLTDVARRALLGLVSLIGLVVYVRRNRIAIIHCTEKPRDAIYGTVVGLLTGAKCVIHVHIKAETWIRPAVRRSMRRAAALIGVSEFVAASIRELGYDAEKVTAVLNGLELDQWTGPAPDPSAVREEFGIAADTPLLVSVSRLYRYKGQHELLGALPIVKREFPDVRVLIVGEDDPRAYRDEASYTAELRRLCDELDLGDNVVFTGFRNDVRAIMAASDLFVMPSHEEPFGMVFIESMVLERPVVALDNGGTVEVVDHGGSGLLSPRGDLEQLAANIVRLLGDDELRREMGANGRRRVAELLNSERMTRDVEAVYDRVLGSDRRP